MTSLFSRLQKLNKEATPPDCGAWRWFGLLARTDAGEPNATDAALIVECRNSLPAVLNLIEAAQRAIANRDVLGTYSGDKLREAVAVFVSGQED